MSDDNISSAPLDQAEVDAQATALLQLLRDSVENNVLVTRTFVHLRKRKLQWRQFLEGQGCKCW